MSVDALSLACNIITIIDFSHKLYETYRNINDQGEFDPESETLAREFSELCTGLQLSRKAAGSTVRDNDQLLRVADQCLTATSKLQVELAKISPPNSSSRLGHRWNSFVSATKRTWRHDRIDQLTKSLQSHQETMQTVILVDLHNSGQAEHARTQDGFDRLDRRVQNFIDAVSKSQLQISDLMAHNRSLQQETHVVIRDMFDAHSHDQKRMQESFQLKNSLRFPGFNERSNAIDDGHQSSFQWLFGNSESPVGAGLPSESDYHLQRASVIVAEGHQGEEPWWEPWYIQNHQSITFGDFDKWLKAGPGSGLYWISGKAGSGKSTLMKFLKERMNKGTIRGKDALVVTHFFWLGPSSSRSRQNDLEGMFSTILHQLLGNEQQDSQPSLATTLLEQDRYLHIKESYTDWNLDELRRITFEALRLLGEGRIIYLLIDALDEHLPTDNHLDLLNNLRDLEGLSNVRLVVSSRREQIFERQLAHAQQLRLEDLTARDIWQFSLESLRNGANIAPDVTYSRVLLDYLVRTVVQNADGVFLWARLAVQSIRKGMADGNTDGELRERLDKIPKTLTQYFELIWKRLGDDETLYQTKAANIFSFLLSGAFKSKYRGDDSSVFDVDDVRPDLMCFSLALAPETARSLIERARSVPEAYLSEMCHRTHLAILSHCAGIVEVDPGSGAPRRCPALDPKHQDPSVRYRFIHRTAADFFRGTAEGQRILDSNDLGDMGAEPRLIQAFLARSLVFRTNEHETHMCNIKKDFAFRHWLRHLHPDNAIGSCFTDNQRQFLISQCHEIYNVSSQSSEWARLTSNREHLTRIYPFVGLLAYYGFDDYVESWATAELQSGRERLSVEFCDYILKCNMMGHSERLVTYLDDDNLPSIAHRFRVSLFVRLHQSPESFQPGIQKLFESTIKSNIRLPKYFIRCMVYNYSGYMYMSWLSTTEVLTERVTALIDRYGDMVDSSEAYEDRQVKIVGDIISELVLILMHSNNQLHDKIACVYRVTVTWDMIKGPFLYREVLPDIKRGFRFRFRQEPEDDEILFEATPAWLIEWWVISLTTHRNHWLSQSLSDRIKAATQGASEVEKPRLIHRAKRDKKTTDVAVTVTKLPPSVGDEVMETLTDATMHMQQHGNIGSMLKSRIENAESDTSIEQDCVTYSRESEYELALDRDLPWLGTHDDLDLLRVERACMIQRVDLDED